MRLILLISLLIISCNSLATVYRWVDENGKVHYSDEPKANAEAVELNENTQNEISIKTPPKAHVTIKEDKATVRYTIIITSPKEEATIRDNNGDLTVNVSVSPQLSRGSMLTLLVDGVLTEGPQTSATFTLSGIFRGEHTIVVNAVAQNGKVLASSSPRKIFLHQASVLGPAKKSN
ncbi:DUF4124 domain-containing protein [Shewanella algicola]|uniref:DUF4124 domain-containing protein n=1 Tax=Shewanella algicola TaxID=640633 RepID=UPI0024941D23|nr:DUF4124 domain-containing protein [Shewanella algicola]